MSLADVASKRRVRQAFRMSPHRVPWLTHLLPMSRRERARLAQLDRTRAGMAAIADSLRDLSARHDAHVHAIQHAARASRGALMESGFPSPIRDAFLSQAADAAAWSRQTAESLDAAVDGLEQMAAGLWER